MVVVVSRTTYAPRLHATSFVGLLQVEGEMKVGKLHFGQKAKKKKRLILCTAHENVDGTRERGHLARGTK